MLLEKLAGFHGQYSVFVLVVVLVVVLVGAFENLA